MSIKSNYLSSSGLVNGIEDIKKSISLNNSTISTRSDPFLILCIQCKNSIPSINFKLQDNQIYIESKCNQCKLEKEIRADEYLVLMKQIEQCPNNCTLKQNHFSNQSTMYCLNCRKWVCEECFSYHQLFPSLKNHQIYSKEMLFDFTCNFHKNKKLKVFCNDCQTALCKKCFENNHNHHSKVLIHSLIEEIENITIKEVLDKIENIRDKNKKNKEAFISLINLEIEELNKIKQNLQYTFEVNENNIRIINDFLLSAHNNYTVFKQVPSYELITNLKKIIDFNKVEPDIYSNELKRNCLNLIYYFKTYCIINVKKEYQCIASFQAHNDKILSLIQMNDGKLASASWDKTIKIWNIQKLKCEVTIRGHSDKVFALTQLKDGRLISSSRDKTIKFWDTSKWICLSTLVGHTNTIFTLLQLKDGRLGSASADKTLKLWDISSFSCLSSGKGHTEAVYSLIELNDGRLASASGDKTIKLWDSSELVNSETLQGHTADISVLLQLSNGRLASGSRDKTIIIWNINELTQIEILRGHRSIVFSLLQLRNGILISGTNQDMLLWNVSSKKPIRTLTEHENDIRGLIEMDNGLVISCSDDRRINIWNF